MIVADDASQLGELSGGSHVCWVVGDSAEYTKRAANVLSQGRAAGQKTVVFGPEGSDVRAQLGPSAVMVADPHVAFLDSGPLEPATMFAMFREQSALAVAEGYAGLCVVADMDWLLPGKPTSDAVVGFELLLDRVVAELNATVVCAYRRASFDTDAITGALAVHPINVGHDEDPPFRFVAGLAGSWQLSGEIDLAVASEFAAAFAAVAATPGGCVVNAGGLTFIDVAGMRAIAMASRTPGVSVRLNGATATLRRAWELAHFDGIAPAVELVA
jgi:anti-anti-sigma regulatory factor